MANRPRLFQKTIFIVAVFFLFLIPLFSGPLVRSAHAEEIILDFASSISVATDGSMTVSEKILVRSEGNKIKRGIYRDFPTRYKDSFNNEYRTEFTPITVLKNGSPEPYHLENIQNGKRVYIGDSNVFLSPGDYEYTITYRTDRQLGFFKDHDELYWNVTGNGWDFPVAAASAAVRLPAGAAGQILETDAYTGRQGDKGKDFTRSIDPDNTVRFMSSRMLNPGEGLTIVVTWPKGFVTEPDTAGKIRYFFHDNRGTLTGLAGFALILIYYIGVWAWAGRDPEPGVIVTRYEPPGRMTPAVTRYIMKMGYDERVFASSLINMAVKGYLTLDSVDGEYTIRKTGGGRDSLAPEEESILKKLLGTGQEIKIVKANYQTIGAAVSGLKNFLDLTYEKIYFVTNRRYFVTGLLISVFVVVLSGLSTSLAKGTLPIFLFMSVWLSGWTVGVFVLLSQVLERWRSLIRNRFRSAVDLGGAVFLSLFSLPFVGGECVGLFMMGYATSLPMVFLVILIAVVNYLFYHLMKAPTRAGRKLLDDVEGFRVFLSATEKDRLNMLNPPQRTPELFEKYLPYALALDLEQQWAEQFSDIISAAATGEAGRPYSPVWYSGTALQAMTAGDLAVSLGDSLAGAVASSSTAPGSSSGSGGGGSSGGGGGGGGGGGW